MNPNHTARLPTLCLITGPFDGPADFHHRLERTLLDGPKLVQVKCKGLTEADCIEVTARARALCTAFGAPLVLAASPEVLRHTEADGLHLSSDRLAGLDQRPLAADKLLSVSCHTADDLQRAEALGADVLLLSPIKPTSSHPDLPGLGWAGFGEMIAGLRAPAYGLGGVSPEDLGEALNAGGQGIACTRGLWS